MATSNYSAKRLGELILYVSKKSANDPDFGATKLNKILYFSDFWAFGKLGKAITGAEYQHLREGPGPRHLLAVREKLVRDGHLAIQKRDYYGYPQVRTINLREPNLLPFTGQQIEIVNWVIEELLRGANATKSSKLSHAEVGWKATKLNETIDYNTIYLSDEPLTEAESRRIVRLQMAQASAVA